MFYRKSEDFSHPLIAHIKTWAREHLFQLPPNLKIAILDNTEITMLNLEQGIPGDRFLRLYYIKYQDNDEKKMVKHRMLNVNNPNQVKTAVSWIRNQEWDVYYFSEPVDAKLEDIDSRE
jgi:hypothetical protein